MERELQRSDKDRGVTETDERSETNRGARNTWKRDRQKSERDRGVGETK